jgi:thioredoxin reductase (NADPH)
MLSEVVESAKVVIIGSGPAGYTAAIYAARANLKPILYQGIQIGGQLTMTNEVENYPGFPLGVDGNTLMTNLALQARNMGADIRYGEVTSVEFTNEWPLKKHIVIIDEGEKTIAADTVIICTGASAKWLGLPNEQSTPGISACATCDGFFYKGKDVAVVGGGDTACEEALHLSKMCNKVYMIIRGREMRASKIMQDRVESAKGIGFIYNSIVSGFDTNEQGKLKSIHLTNSYHTNIIEVSALFVAIGHTPNSALFKGQITLDNDGYIVTQQGTTKTNIPGVFAAGDVQDRHYRQAITAAGSGCMAAIDAERFLSFN